MDPNERPDQEPEAPTEGSQHPAPKSRQSLAHLRRELTDQDLSNPAVARTLIETIDRLDVEVAELKDYRDRFHASDKSVGVFQERLKRALSADVISATGLTVGAAALGYAPNLWSHQPSGWIAIVFGVVLIIGGLAARILRS